jgi:hypothetical protein
VSAAVTVLVGKVHAGFSPVLEERGGGSADVGAATHRVPKDPRKGADQLSRTQWLPTNSGGWIS